MASIYEWPAASVSTTPSALTIGMGSGIYFCGVYGCQITRRSLSESELDIKGSKIRVSKSGFHATKEVFLMSTAYWTMDYNKLVKDCLKGLPDAQRLLYEHFAESMLGVCYRYTK